ncbi:aspartate ammonia-lyase, partial [Pseudomonas aeruginosa]
METDLHGTLEVPAYAYYGIQPLRAVTNARRAGAPRSHDPPLVGALPTVQQPAADANRQLRQL